MDADDSLSFLTDHQLGDETSHGTPSSRAVVLSVRAQDKTMALRRKSTESNLLFEMLLVGTRSVLSLLVSFRPLLLFLSLFVFCYFEGTESTMREKRNVTSTPGCHFNTHVLLVFYRFLIRSGRERKTD